MTNLASKLAPDAKADIVEGLTQAIAETAIETAKAQSYHWNVVGMAFGPLHDLFQKIYEDHFEAQDELAERVKALDAHAEGRPSKWMERSKIKECAGDIDAKTMIANLAKDQETLSETLLALAEASDNHNDWVTNDMAVERAQVHDKFAWMLRAHLQ